MGFTPPPSPGRTETFLLRAAGSLGCWQFPFPWNLKLYSERNNLFKKIFFKWCLLCISVLKNVSCCSKSKIRKYVELENVGNKWKENSHASHFGLFPPFYIWNCVLCFYKFRVQLDIVSYSFLKIDHIIVYSIIDYLIPYINLFKYLPLAGHVGCFQFLLLEECCNENLCVLLWLFPKDRVPEIEENQKHSF